jgi:LCP family protein required for cell wall assembly
MLVSIIGVLVLACGVVGSWAIGVRLPGVSGATYLRAVKVHAHYAPGSTSNGVLYMVLVGSDLRSDVAGSRGDAVHLVALNPVLHAGTIVNIPRDTCTDVPGRGHVRINEANSQGGPALVAQVVSNMTGIPVTYAMSADFQGFLGLVDGVGGVDVNVPYPMHDSYSGADLNPGPQHLNGLGALSFARDRHSFGRSDIIRTWDQAYLIIAGFRHLQSEYASFAGHFEVAALMVSHAELSGVSLTDLLKLGEVADRVPSTNIKNVNIPITGSACLGIGAAAPQLFADVRDDGVLEHYPAGTPGFPDPQP